MGEFVVYRLDVGDPDALLFPHPVGGFLHHVPEPLVVGRPELRPQVDTRRHKVGAAYGGERTIIII